MRRFFHFVLLGLAVGVPQASAQSTSLTAEPLDVVGIGPVLETPLAVPGDGWTDPSALVVTDHQLLAADS
jgi:hypothetical protein